MRPADPLPRQLTLFDEPPACPADLPADCSWHTALLAGTPTGYALRRSRRKSIGLVIRDSGLLIQAPAWASRRQIEEAIEQKSAWIRNKLQLCAQRREALGLQGTPWRDGGCIPYLGVPLELRLDGACPLHYVGDPAVPRAGDELHLPLPTDAGPPRIEECTQAWLHERARLDLGARLEHFLALAGESVTSWSLSSAQARWGSCTSRRRIRLNWRLIHFAPALVDYVVAHEVAHLRHMNHSAAFWDLVSCLYPESKPARQALAHQAPGMPALP